jgi:hypothetical protein
MGGEPSALSPALLEVVEKWPVPPRSIVQAMRALVRTAVT